VSLACQIIVSPAGSYGIALGLSHTHASTFRAFSFSPDHHVVSRDLYTVLCVVVPSGFTSCVIACGITTGTKKGEPLD
jgi:hypothetical protein